MNGSAKETLLAIEDFKLFSSVGREGEAVKTPRIVSSWYEAMDVMDKCDWDNFCLNLGENYRGELLRRDRDSTSKWNKVVEEIRPRITRFVDSVNLEVHKEVLDTAKWDLLHVCIEAEFSAIIPPGFYCAQSYWYSVGHFPCGWEGEFPSGRPIIY